MNSMIGMSGGSRGLSPDADCLPPKKRPRPAIYKPLAHKAKDLPNGARWVDRARWVGPRTDLEFPPGHVGIERDVPYDPVREGVDIMRWVEQQRDLVAYGQSLCLEDPTCYNGEFSRSVAATMKGLLDATCNTPYSRWPPRDFSLVQGPHEDNVSVMLATLLMVIKETEENEAWVKWY
jgi:hypothetical protein